MSEIFLGSLMNGSDFCIPKRAFHTHFHLIGGTGKGKTTAIHTLLHPLMRDHRDPAAFFIVDRMGNLSWELLLWLNSKFCPSYVRDRVIYIEAAREDVVMGFNPLLYETEQHAYYKIERATEVILRAWESTNIEAMPRLARWIFNAFYAAAHLGLTIADTMHLLMPGSDLRPRLLKLLPPMLQAEWKEIEKGQEGHRILDSSRNRMRPYFTAPILRRMFGSTKNHLDVLRFMREGRIVIVNLASQNRIATQLGDTIGGLLINEIISNARALPMGVTYPTYLLLDEFQNFVGPDMESAIPEVRQLGLRLLLSHQSFSQLKRGEHDLSSIIWQMQSRLAFGVQGEDADILGHEFGSLTFDPMRVKHEMFSTRQKIVGHEKVMLHSWNEAKMEAESWNKIEGEGWDTGKSRARRDYEWIDTNTQNDRHSRNEQNGSGGSRQNSSGHGQAEHLLPVHEDVRELSRVTFYTGDEWDRRWAKQLRLLPTGVCLARLSDNPKLFEVAVERSAIGYLGLETPALMRRYPHVIDQVHAFIENNFRSEFFVSPQTIDHETEQRLSAILNAPIIVNTQNGKDLVLAEDKNNPME